jgi:hypothetical protein
VKAREFQPGFRLSLVDCVVIVVGLIAAVALWSRVWWLGFVVAFVVAHFFLFCNVFRIARWLELCWSGVFVGLVAPTILFGTPSWPITIVAALVMTAIVVRIEMRKPSYHGVLWRRINPELPKWWSAGGGQRPDALSGSAR